MITWLKDLFHIHKWRTIKEVKVVDSAINPEVVQYTRYYLQCTHCGKIKVVG